MKKLTVWALLATFVVAGSLFAAPGIQSRGVAADATFLTGQPATTNNDDSCDISVAPAATLLLPYFEVAEDPAGETTLFTITNVSQYPAIAHVVLWTDFSYPVIDFNIYLTGYDVQSINLNDVIWRGVVAPADAPKELGTGTIPSTGTGTGDFDEIEPGSGMIVGGCDQEPGNVPAQYQARMQSAFTLGTVAAVPGSAVFTACNNVGNVHENAVGYATIDVVNLCTTALPTDGDTYFSDAIRFDNVLIGDYQQVNSGENFAQGNPMVHIRAVPELNGNTGPAATNFDRTFYSRYQQPAPDTIDRRQPLPATFAARWISGGTGSFETSFKIWREGVNPGTTCATVDDNGLLVVAETVIFDEHENGEGFAPEESDFSPVLGADVVTLPETSLTNIEDIDTFPQSIVADNIAGWVYFNLHNPDADDVEPFATQNWVVVSMRAEGRYSVDFDAAWLGNGCSPIAPITSYSDEGLPPVNNPGAQDPDAVLPGPAPDFTPDLQP
jgi:hypothetical protein